MGKKKLYEMKIMKCTPVKTGQHVALPGLPVLLQGVLEPGLPGVAQRHGVVVARAVELGVHPVIISR